MKILHIYKCYSDPPMGGVEQTIKQISLGLKNYQIKNDIFTTGSKDKNYNYGKKFVSKELFEISSCKFTGLDFFIKFYSIINKYDLFIFHYPWPFGDLLSILILIKKKNYVIYYHSDIIKQKFLNLFYKPLEKFFLNNSSHIFTSSKKYFNTSKNLKKYKSKISIIPLFYTNKNKEFKKKKINLKKNNLRKNNYFIFVGTYRYYKGIEILVKAADYFKNFKIVLIGKNIKKNINSNATNVVFLEKINNEEKNFLIKNSLSLILPSTFKSEAFGYVLLEALILQVPMISTKLGTGTDYVNKNNFTGITIKPNSLSELVKAMQKIIDNKKKYNLYSTNCQKHYNKNFDANKITNKLFKKLISIKKIHS